MALKQKCVFGQLLNLWTMNEEEFLWENYSKMSTNEIASILGKTEDSVSHKAVRLGLKKNHWIIRNVHLSDREIGYIAAAIDGEGTIMLTRGSGKRLMPTITIVNTNLPFLYKIQRIMGGSITRKHDLKAKILWKPCYQLWIHTTARAYPVLKQIVDELVIKQAHARLLLEFCERRLKRANQCDSYTKRDLEIRNRIMELNKRGITE